MNARLGPTTVGRAVVSDEPRDSRAPRQTATRATQPDADPLPRRYSPARPMNPDFTKIPYGFGLAGRTRPRIATNCGAVAGCGLSVW